MKNILFYLFLAIICLLMSLNSSLLTIIYGVCIFLYAMSVLNKSFELFTDIEVFLQKATKTRFSSFIFGLGTTAIMQSSGLVSVLAISFLSAGLIALGSGLAIIYGANLGTVTGAWLVAGLGVKIDIAKYAMPMIVVGLFCLISNSKKIKGVGYFIFSIGLLFLGIAYMKSGFDDIKATLDLSKYAMSGIAGLLVYTLIGLVMTVVMQSSHATLTLAIAALSVNQISYENAVAIAIGSNVGSTVMAVIGSINANSEGKKLTIAHLIFNITSAVITLVFVNFFIYLTDLTAKLAQIANDNYTIKLAIFHTYFNGLGVVIFYPFTQFMVNSLNRFVKDNSKRARVSQAIYLSDEALNFQGSALKVLTLELKHLYENTSSILAKSISISKEDIASNLSSAEVIKMRFKPMDIDFDELYDTRFKQIYSQIIDYAALAGAKADAEHFAKFTDVRRATLLMAEALKDIKNSQPNLYKFMNSNNEFIKAEYDKLRVKALKSLRVMYKIINLSNTDDVKGEIKELTQIYHDYDKDELQLDVLLVGKKISNTMATSLMNDTAFIKNMTKKLLKIVELIATRSGEVNFGEVREKLGVEVDQ